MRYELRLSRAGGLHEADDEDDQDDDDKQPDDADTGTKGEQG
jgi:hypothetical protein